MNNYNKVTTKTVILVLLILSFVLALLQSMTTPLSFIEEGIYHLQPYDTKGFLKGSIYFGVYLASLLAIVLALFTRNKFVATLLIGFITLTYGIDLLVQFIGSNEKGISLGMFSLAMVEQSRANDMIMFRTQLFESLGVVVAFVSVILFLRLVVLKSFRVNTFVSVLGFFGLSLVAFGSVYFVFSIVGQSYPAPIKTLAIAYEYYQEDINQEPRILAETIKPESKAKYKTIVWVVDESVGGQYLSVNGYNKKTTPYLESINNDSTDYFNFGVVPSIANCSAASNLMLRVGLTTAFEEGSIKDLKKTLPTIFQYAKRAGFETTLIDAQVAKGQLQNHLSITDKDGIDNYVTFGRSFLPNTRDRQAMKQLKNILDKKDDKNRFVFVVKWGAHWPYPLTYHKKVFQPAAEESYTEMSEENKELIFNAYYNSLRYSVDDFLRELTSGRKFEDQIVFYTSDHGQSLYQNDDPLTHCHEGERLIPLDEFKVPLMVFSDNIRNTLSKPQGRANMQEQLFPTTLSLMGYPQDVIKTYGPTLFEGMDKHAVKVNVGASNRRINFTNKKFYIDELAASKLGSVN